MLPTGRRCGTCTASPHEYDDPHTWIGEVGNVLVIDKDGRAEGGEVTELLKTLLPAVAKRPDAMTGIHQVRILSSSNWASDQMSEVGRPLPWSLGGISVLVGQRTE